MAGLLSNLFDDGSSSQSNDTTVSSDYDTGAELSPSADVGMGGSYENADGSTTTWQNDTTVGVDVDVDAALATTTTLGTDTVEG